MEDALRIAMTKMILVMCVLTGSASAGFADGSKRNKLPEMSAEQRGQMASAHEKMATCLRSERALSECKDEMKKSCHEIMGKDCPMMMGDMGEMKAHGKMKPPGND